MPTAATFLLIGFALAGIWLESGARSWSVIYLRDTFGAVNWLAALTLPVVLSTQVIGRLLSDGWIERYGPVRVAAILSGFSFAGLVLVALAISIPVSLVGFALIGVGVASSFPQAISAAARLGDRPSSENVAALSMLQTIAQFLAPPIMGLTAARWGIQVSFAIILPLPILSIFLARYLAPRPAPA